MKIKFTIILSTLLLLTTAQAQTTVFTYQGKLTDSGTPQAIYQMEFRLFGSPGGSDQIGGVITNPNVAVTQGVFTVQLDFGASSFPGADRFLEIAVRRSSAESFVTLNPRQQITSSPYSIRTLSAAQADVALDSQKLGGLDASEYVTTTTVGNSFVKNATTQQIADFNINGSGFVGGNFGVGTTAPTSKLQVLASGYGITQTAGGVTVGSFISTSGGGSGWFGTRSDHPLNFFTNDALPQMTLSTTGNFGIGITNPTARLQVFSPVAGTTGVFSESATGRAVWGKSTSSRGVYGESNSLEGVYGVSGSGAGVSGNSTSNIGVYGESGGASGAGIYARNLAGGRAFYAEGNAAQSLASSGLVKAMIFVNQNGTINHCYNSITNSSVGNCGFTISTPQPGYYDINFGFQIDNRYITTQSLNNLAQGGCTGGGMSLDAAVGNSVRATTFCTLFVNKPFMIFVY